MSRIHEALKKAAQERSVQLAKSGDTTFAELAAAPTAPVATEPIPLSGLEVARIVPPSPAADNFAYLRYEDLIAKCASPQWRPDARLSVFEGNEDKQVGAERFRTLRSRLYQIAGTRPLRRVMVTSSVPAEGKTFVAANLAQSIVRQPDRKVLLIDADLRASRLHQVLGAPRSPGLSDYLSGDADEYQVVQKGSDA